MLADPAKQNTGDSFKSSMPSPESNVPDWSTNCHRKTSTFGQVTHETHTMASEEQLESTGNSGENHPHPKITPPTFKVVAGGKQCYHRTTPTPSSICVTNLYRRIKRRVGCSLKRAHDKRKLVTPRKQTAHKLPRVKSSPSGLKRIPSSLYKQGSSHSYRQHHFGSIYKQGRGNEVGPSVCFTLENPHLVHQKPGNPHICLTYARSFKCDSRQIIHPNRVVSQSRDIPNNMQPVAHPPSGSVCHKVQQQAPTICLTGSRPTGLGSRCSQPVLGGTGPVRLPTSSHLGQSGGEITGLPVQQDHSDCPGLAQHALVWGSSDNVQSESLVSTQHTRLSVSTVQPSPTQEPVKSESACLAPRASAIKEQGFSEAVAARIEAPQRRSTRSVYEAKWTKVASVIRWTSGHHL